MDDDRHKYDYTIVTDDGLEIKDLNWEEWQAKAKELHEFGFKQMRVYAFFGEKFIKYVDFRYSKENWINLERRK